MGRAERDGRVWHYLDDGTLRRSVLAGPTCDSIDVIDEDIALPELEIGDLVVGRMIGAYTSASATDFNFVRRTRVVVVDRRPASLHPESASGTARVTLAATDRV